MESVTGGRLHRQTFLILFVCMYVVAMAFFAVVRAFGLLWFMQEPPAGIGNPWVDFFVKMGLWVLDGVIFTKTLTLLTTNKSILIVTMHTILAYAALFVGVDLFIVFEVSLFLFVPLVVNKDKEKSLGYSLLYGGLIMAYTMLMMWGRGYPMIARYSAPWQLLAMIDYKMLIVGILFLKEVLRMPPNNPGCFFFFGKFDKLARKIGHFLLHPVAAIRGN